MKKKMKMMMMMIKTVTMVEVEAMILVGCDCFQGIDRISWFIAGGNGFEREIDIKKMF